MAAVAGVAVAADVVVGAGEKPVPAQAAKSTLDTYAGAGPRNLGLANLLTHF